ncbi:MAG: hypothetical protein MJZ09_03485 [Bacteroidales bacterium]|nr:hypothetical protein [Bacteroidales bacterium]
MDFKRVIKTIVNALKAVMKGELLLKMNAGKYFLHIAWTFALCAGIIGYRIIVDSALSRVEKNSAEIRELQIIKSSKEYELKSLYRRSSIATMLQEKGSTLQEPEKPAVRLVK